MDAGANHLHLFGRSSVVVSAFSWFEAQHSIVRFSAQCLTLTHPQHSVSESGFTFYVSFQNLCRKHWGLAVFWTWSLCKNSVLEFCTLNDFVSKASLQLKFGDLLFLDRQSLQELCFEILHSEQVHLLCLHFLATAFTGMWQQECLDCQKSISWLGVELVFQHGHGLHKLKGMHCTGVGEGRGVSNLLCSMSHDCVAKTSMGQSIMHIHQTRKGLFESRLCFRCLSASYSEQSISTLLGVCSALSQSALSGLFCSAPWYVHACRVCSGRHVYAGT